jgi:hypothetical protein
MARLAYSLSFAFLASLAWGSLATAADPLPTKSGFSAAPAATMTLGGHGTAASAAGAADSELAWYHGYYRGYRRGYYNGFYGGLGYPYYAGYYPAIYPYGVGYYSPAYYPPVLGYSGRLGGISVGLYGINATGSDLTAPAVSLNLANPSAPRPNSTAPASAPTATPGLYQYDGGPMNPVPLPKQDPNIPSSSAAPTPAPNAGLPVSLPKTSAPAPTKPYVYKAYGEK